MTPDSEAQAPTAPTADHAARFKWALRLILGIALLTYLVNRGDGATFARALGRAPLWVLAAAAAWYLAGQVLSAWKWQILLAAGGARVSLMRCCALYWLGMFSNLWLPSSIGGD